MSLASTVSSVIDVPATQSSGRRADLAGLDRRDLVLGRGEERPVLARRCRPRSAARRAPAGRRASPTSDHDHRADRQRRQRPSAATIDARGPMPSATLPTARTTMIAGEPMRRHQHERDEQAADDRADRVDREQRPGFAAGGAGVVAEQDRRGREGDAQHDRHGQDDEQRRPEQRLEGLDRLARGRAPAGWPMTKTSPSSTSAADDHLARRPAAGAGPRAATRISRRSGRRWRSRSRNVARITVKTYVVLPVPDASSRVHVTW